MPHESLQGRASEIVRRLPRCMLDSMISLLDAAIVWSLCCLMKCLRMGMPCICDSEWDTVLAWRGSWVPGRACSSGCKRGSSSLTAMPRCAPPHLALLESHSNLARDWSSHPGSVHCIVSSWIQLDGRDRISQLCPDGYDTGHSSPGVLLSSETRPWRACAVWC